MECCLDGRLMADWVVHIAWNTQRLDGWITEESIRGLTAIVRFYQRHMNFVRRGICLVKEKQKKMVRLVGQHHS